MKIQKKLGAAVLSLGLVVGLSGFAGATTGTIDTTGPQSDNTVEVDTSHRVEIENDNELYVENDNDQEAETGEAEVEDNNRGGDAETGDARNSNAFTGSVTVDNSASAADVVEATTGGNGGGADRVEIRDTGPRSDNHVEIENRSTVEIENDNELTVVNNNNQEAESGDATVENNTRGGSATTGDASNTNSTSVTFRVTN